MTAHTVWRKGGINPDNVLDNILFTGDLIGLNKPEAEEKFSELVQYMERTHWDFTAYTNPIVEWLRDYAKEDLNSVYGDYLGLELMHVQQFRFFLRKLRKEGKGKLFSSFIYKYFSFLWRYVYDFQMDEEAFDFCNMILTDYNRAGTLEEKDSIWKKIPSLHGLLPRDEETVDSVFHDEWMEGIEIDSDDTF